MIRAVVFDLGKVLVDFDYTVAARKVAAQCRMSPEEIYSFMAHSPLLPRYETGLLTTDQFFHEICAVTGYRGGAEEFADTFGDIFTAIEPMIDLHARLRRRGMPTCVFSNTNELAVRHIRRHFPFYAQFDAYVLSYEQGFMKPQAGLYEVVERKTGRQGGELLYIDDREDNLATAAARGWQVILQESPDKTLAQFDRLGVL